MEDKVALVMADELRRRAKQLADSVRVLPVLLEDQVDRLKREEEAECLRNLRSSILDTIEEARRSESFARVSSSELASRNALASAGVMLLVQSPNKDMQEVSHRVLAPSTRKEPPFGTILVRIGPGGLPDDCSVVNLSRLARESCSDESQIKSEVLGHGGCMVTGEAFSDIVERLVIEMAKRPLHFPVPVEEVSRSPGKAPRSSVFFGSRVVPKKK